LFEYETRLKTTRCEISLPLRCCIINNALASLTLLLTKVREGVWGDMPMPANNIEKINDTDLKTLLEWILAL